MVQAGYILASAEGPCVHAPVAVLRTKTSLLGTLLTRPPNTTILDPSSLIAMQWSALIEGGFPVVFKFDQVMVSTANSVTTFSVGIWFVGRYPPQYKILLLDAHQTFP